MADHAPSMRPQHGPWRRCCYPPTLTYGPTFPFVQFKSPEAGERMRAVFRAQAVGPAREANMYRARRQTMRGANKWFVALSTALALAAVSSQTVAQDSAARAARDAAIHKCINQAHREVPGGESQDMQRSEAYKACMVSAGFQP